LKTPVVRPVFTKMQVVKVAAFCQGEGSRVEVALSARSGSEVAPTREIEAHVCRPEQI
jgi:hypothetical protein